MNQNTKEWPDADKQFSEEAYLKSLMQTLPEVDANADEDEKREQPRRKVFHALMVDLDTLQAKKELVDAGKLSAVPPNWQPILLAVVSAGQRLKRLLRTDENHFTDDRDENCQESR